MPELLEVSMVASVAGEIKGGALTNRRPFRAPHHSASMPALVGGGLHARVPVSISRVKTVLTTSAPAESRTSPKAAACVLKSRRTRAGASGTSGRLLMRRDRTTF
jgi:hypothetical protein